MPRIKQVLRCYVAGNGTRTISSLMDISRNIVKKYITTFNQSGKTIEEILAMDEPDLLRLFNEKPDPQPPLPKSDRYTQLMDRMPEYARMLRKWASRKLWSSSGICKSIPTDTGRASSSGSSSCISSRPLPNVSEKHSTIICCLDNDAAGHAALETLRTYKQELRNPAIVDGSLFYYG